MHGETVEIAAGLPGYLSLPEAGEKHPGILLFAEAFGINDYIRNQCDRLAQAGYAVLAPDFFRGVVLDYNDFGKALEIIQSLGDAGFTADANASLDYFARHDRVSGAPYGAIGFCLGGRIAFLAAVEFGERIAAAACYYGGGIAPEKDRMGRPNLAARAGEIRAKLRLFYGADDAGITPAEHGAIAQALSEAKVEYALNVFAGAGHAFANDVREAYRPEAAKVAWGEALALFAHVWRER